MDWSGVTAVIAVIVAVGTLIREWIKDRGAEEKSARADAAAWYERWQDAEARAREAEESFRSREAEWLSDMVRREQRWEAKCSELAAQIEALQREVRTLKNGG